jgi:hypothetical protein
MPDEFDPARRLYDILSVAREHGDSETARVAWSKALGLPPDNRLGIYQGLATLVELVNEVEQAVKACPGADAKLLLEKVPLIRKAIGIGQLDADWTSQRKFLSEVTVRDLLHCSNALQRVQPERKIADDTLSQLDKEAVELTEEVLNSADLDPELRTVLLVCLETFRRAIAEYRIRGAEGLRSAAEATVGRLFFVQEKAKATSKRNLIVRLWSLVRTAHSIASMAKDATPLAEAAYRAAQLALTGDAPPPTLPPGVSNV